MADRNGRLLMELVKLPGEDFIFICIILIVFVQGYILLILWWGGWTPGKNIIIRVQGILRKRVRQREKMVSETKRHPSQFMFAGGKKKLSQRFGENYQYYPCQENSFCPPHAGALKLNYIFLSSLFILFFSRF